MKSIYEALQAQFAAGGLRYTFAPCNAMAKEKAHAWTDPGFPIYVGD